MNYLISKKIQRDQDSIEYQHFDSHSDSCFRNIRVLGPIQTEVTRGTQMHLMLTVGDTWCERAGDRAWFGIKVNNKVVTKGLYSAVMAEQRIPITLQALFVAPIDGPVTIQAVWCNGDRSGRCHIGEWGDVQLIAGVEAHELD